MKNSKLVILIVLILNLFTVACSEEDDTNSNSSSENVMSFGGDQINIEAAISVFYGENEDGSYDWDIELLSEGFTINNSDETVTGVGDIFYIDLNTNSESGLVPGIYTFSDEYERAEFTWVYAVGAKNVSYEEGAENEDNIFEAASGTISITGTGNNQVIEANLLDENGNTLNATYSGSFQTFEYPTNKT